MDTNRKIFLERYRYFMPKGAGALFFIQMFATLSFSVLYSTLILYATHALHLSDRLATSLTGSFVALNFFLHLLGGYIGGRFFSYRTLFAIGMVLQVLGCLLLSIQTNDGLLWGLAFFLGGSGLNVTCINCMVTQLFEPADKRRETAFLWNYSGMNIGFFVGFYISGYYHLHQGYHELFILSALGNLIAFCLTLLNWKILKDQATLYIESAFASRKKSRHIGLILVITLVFIIRILLQHTDFCNQLISFIGLLMLGLIAYIAFQQEDVEEKNKIWAFIILALSALIFWTLYQLAPMGLNLFIDRNVDRHFLGLIIAPQWLQNLNSFLIILGGPLFGFIFTYLREKGVNISIPFQFSVALILIGIGFAILPVGIHNADANGYVNFNWIIASYTLQSIGELFISPIGYAMIGQLAPIRLRGLMMGMWMMITGIAAIFSNHYSQAALGMNETINPLLTNPSYSHIFGMLGWSALLLGMILLVFTPLVIKFTYERKTVPDFKPNLELS